MRYNFLKSFILPSQFIVAPYLTKYRFLEHTNFSASFACFFSLVFFAVLLFVFLLKRRKRKSFLLLCSTQLKSYSI